MLGVLANDHNAALALDDLAFFTDFLDRRSYLHCACLLPSPCAHGAAELYRIPENVDLIYFSIKTSC